MGMVSTLLISTLKVLITYPSQIQFCPAKQGKADHSMEADIHTGVLIILIETATSMAILHILSDTDDNKRGGLYQSKDIS